MYNESKNKENVKAEIHAACRQFASLTNCSLHLNSNKDAWSFFREDSLHIKTILVESDQKLILRLETIIVNNVSFSSQLFFCDLLTNNLIKELSSDMELHKRKNKMILIKNYAVHPNLDSVYQSCLFALSEFQHKGRVFLNTFFEKFFSNQLIMLN
jgi:hypothetical protein